MSIIYLFWFSGFSFSDSLIVEFSDADLADLSDSTNNSYIILMILRHWQLKENCQIDLFKLTVNCRQKYLSPNIESFV